MTEIKSQLGGGDDYEKPVIPSFLNVITILTFIGSGIGFIFTLLTPVFNKFVNGFLEKAKTSSTRELTGEELANIEKMRSLIELTQANIIPLIAIGLVGITLCVAGAMMMRKLKKDGFWIYTGGELLPVIGNLILLGTSQYTGVASIIFSAGIPLLFVILYATQRKYLVY